MDGRRADAPAFALQNSWRCNVRRASLHFPIPARTVPRSPRRAFVRFFRVFRVSDIALMATLNR